MQTRSPFWSTGRPYHDVQMAVTGPVAAALGDLARDRWRRATGERLSAPRSAGGDWRGVAFDVKGVEMAIARTRPAALGEEGVREVEQLYLDAIAAAQDWIYIENLPSHIDWGPPVTSSAFD